MAISITIRPLGAKPCTLCHGDEDYGVEFRGHRRVKDPNDPKFGQIVVTGNVSLCSGCLDEIGRLWIDELLREGHVETMATLLDQLATRLHRQN
jgi:hypothetical protein